MRQYYNWRKRHPSFAIAADAALQHARSVTFDPIRVAWAAGIFEGEGTIRLHRSGRHRTPAPSLQVGMTDQDVVLALQAALGGLGAIYGPYAGKLRPRAKPIYQWGVSHRSARVVIRQLYPFLGARRRAKAEEVFGRELFDENLRDGSDEGFG